jgi:hypothetical protein
MINPTFSKQITNRNFLSPVGFKFTLAKNPKLAFFCNSAKIPEITLGTETQDNYLKTIDVPGDIITYGDFSLRFLVDEDLVNYMEIHKWITGLGFPETAQQYKDLITTDGDTLDPKRGFSDGSLYILDNNYNTNVIVKFKDLFPISLTSLNFDATQVNPEYFTASVNFKYTVYNILDKNNKPL